MDKTKQAQSDGTNLTKFEAAISALWIGYGF